MTTLTSPDRTVLEQLSRRTALPVTSSVAVRIAYILLLWSQRRRTRMALKQLPKHVLDDIGLSSEAARDEYMKPYWRP